MNELIHGSQLGYCVVVVVFAGLLLVINKLELSLSNMAFGHFNILFDRILFVLTSHILKIVLCPRKNRPLVRSGQVRGQSVHGLN